MSIVPGLSKMHAQLRLHDALAHITGRCESIPHPVYHTFLQAPDGAVDARKIGSGLPGSSVRLEAEAPRYIAITLENASHRCDPLAGLSYVVVRALAVVSAGLAVP